MINFKLMKQQLKSIFTITIIFFIILNLIVWVTFIISPVFTRLWKDGQYYKGWVELAGGKTFRNWYYLPIFLSSIFLVSKLISAEINNGWMTSWLTLPMSRKRILTSKLLVIIMAISLISVSELILQLILFTIVYKDFTSTGQLQLVLDNFFKLCFWILWTAIVWCIACIFNKSSTYKIIVYTLMVLFLFCFVFGQWKSETTNLWTKNPEKIKQFNSMSLQKIKTYLPYFSITSLYNFVLHVNLKPINSKWAYAPLEAVRAKDCAWQIPTMISISAILFTCGNYRFIKKDLPL